MRAIRSTVTALFATTLALTLSLDARQPPIDLDAVFERLDRYLEQYESELSSVVADEELIQETDGRLMSSKRTRRLSSEVAFVRLPGNLEWLGFRSVRSVNGKPLLATKRLAELLANSSADAIAQASMLVNDSAKYNLGNPRTTNMPNLPLVLLSRHYRHRYETKHEGRSRMRGHATDTVGLTEIGGEPIVYNDGRQMQSHVRAWVDATSGALWRAEVELKVPGDYRNPTWLRVDFAEDKTLKMLVPVQMRERFNFVADTGTGVATYSNFRRFQTSARIVPPPGTR
jgi:hypothetical protein